MCRLFGQHARPDLDRSEALCSAHNALRFQSHKHPHGWGIAWYRGHEVVVRRGLLPAHADEAFVEAARQARSQVVLAHVRDASVGPVSEPNTHPFVHGRWVFAHNGTVARVRLDRATVLEVEEALVEVTRTVQRLADSPRVKPSSLNFLVSDGRLLAATRLGRDLHVASAAGPEGAFVIASEPIGPGAWTSVPDGSFVGFDGEAAGA